MREIDIGPRFYGADIKDGSHGNLQEQFIDQTGVIWENLDYDYAREYDNYLAAGGEKPPQELFKDSPRNYVRKDFPKNGANGNINFVGTNSRPNNVWKSSQTRRLDMNRLGTL